jgi:hypothetical protein
MMAIADEHSWASHCEGLQSSPQLRTAGTPCLHNFFAPEGVNSEPLTALLRTGIGKNNILALMAIVSFS